MCRVVGGESGRGKPRCCKVIARKVAIHGDGCRNPELVGDGILVWVEARVPDHTPLAEFRFPASSPQVPEDS